MTTKKATFKTIPVDTKVTWHYRSAIGHGTVTGVHKMGTNADNTMYSVRETKSADCLYSERIPLARLCRSMILDGIGFQLLRNSPQTSARSTHPGSKACSAPTFGGNYAAAGIRSHPGSSTC